MKKYCRICECGEPDEDGERFALTFPPFYNKIVVTMKTDIHPQYYPNAKIKCACGHTWTMGSTAEETNVAICGNCHPFYTGTEKIIDARGRVEKFKKKMEKVHSKSRAK